MNLQLTTPTKFNAFPYEKPYGIQDDLMRHLYTAIEKRQVTIIESPTGTGKTLSLLCSALTWLLDDKERARKGELAISSSSSSEPDWVIAQSIERRRRVLIEADEAYEENLRKARHKEAVLRRMVAKARKRLRVADGTSGDAELDDDAFLPEDEASGESDDDNVSPAVRALMAKLHRPSTNEDEVEPTCTKIYYASRTHSQLTQVLPEMRRLNLGVTQSATPAVEGTARLGTKRPAEDDDLSASHILRSVALGSRKQLCINESLRRRHGDLDEACRQLLNENGDRRCPHLPPTEEQSKMHEFRDQILASPKDIEELAELGRMAETCPYFGSRSAIPQAQLVTLPYNLLLQRNAREALGIDLKDQVLVIDEAHNLIPTLLSLSSTSLSFSTLSTSLQQLSAYYSRFRTRLSATHGLHIKRLVALLKELQTYCTRWQTDARAQKSASAEVMKVGELLGRLNKNVEGINLLEISDYLRKSKIARKINGYAEKVAAKAQPGKATKPIASANPPLHAIEAFIVALSSANDDGRVSLALSGEKMEIKYQLLNPATHFRQVLNDARCVILAGGTMSPMSDYTSQLFSHLATDRLSVFSCGHIIPPQNLQAVILGRGPSGKELEFKFANRGDDALLTELGQLVLNFSSLIPAGMIIFLPSYAFLDGVVASWKKSGVWSKLLVKKKIFMEPRDTDVEVVLREYAAELHRQPSVNEPKPGALLLAVVGAKLSEGLNFTDDLARGVLVVGIPFPNSKSIELQERMKYVSHSLPKTEGGRDPAADLYENMAMNAVNQSIGRAIRHGGDWAGLILVDKRYGSARIRGKLPKWIGDSITAPENFGGAMKTLGAFYRGRKIQ